MTLDDLKFFFLSAIFTASALIAVIIFSNTCFALDGDEAKFQPVYGVPFGEIVPDDEGGSETAQPEPGELPTEEESASVPSGGSSFGEDTSGNEEGANEDSEEENASSSSVSSEGDGVTDIEDHYKPDYLDSGYVDGQTPAIPSPEENIFAMRRYMEFFLFGLIPISLAVFLIVLLCVWFYKTFVPRF